MSKKLSKRKTQPQSAMIPDLQSPGSYPKRVLLCVTGLSPQIVTETLYALAVARQPAWVPHEIRLITTVTGKREAELNLLAKKLTSGNPGWFHRLRADYGLPEIQLDERRIHVLTDAEGRALDDIRTPEDNEQAADFISGIMRDLTMDSDSELHVSIAGGRKTMGYYLGYALSLYGRRQDRLSHVLVSEPYENNRDFYYPTPYQHPISVRRGEKEQTFDAREARVQLAEIPFVRLRHGLPRKLQEGKVRYSEAVGAVQKNIGPPELVLDLRHRRIRAGAQILLLSPVNLAFLAWFARRACEGLPALDALDEKDIDNVGEIYRDAFMTEYLRIDPIGDEGRVAKRLKQGMLRGWFDERRSKLHEQLRSALSTEAQPYLIHGAGRRPKRYSLMLSPEAIRFAPVMPDSGKTDDLG